jgi:hypothetical protein
VAAPTENGKAFVSPVVARIAAEHGIDPSTVPGTGAGAVGGPCSTKALMSFFVTRPPQHRPRPLRRLHPPRSPPHSPRRYRLRHAKRSPAKPSSRSRRCAAGSPSTCAARSTPRRTSPRRSRST